MFVLTLLADTIRIPPPLLSRPTLSSIQAEIERRYPNKVIVDVGLVVCPFGPPLQVGDGVLVPGDGGAHHQVIFQCVVFRPFLDEVLLGTVIDCNEEGICVSVGGFFDEVFIPAYWMLNPSTFDENTGLWVWMPNYDDDDHEQQTQQKQEQTCNGSQQEEGSNNHQDSNADQLRFEIEIGAEIRFKVKSVNFTRITTTMKGVQATTTTTGASNASSSDRAFGLNGMFSSALPTAENGKHDMQSVVDGVEVRTRSSSADLTDCDYTPAPMQIVGSICEDGLGLTSWWASASPEEEEQEEGEMEHQEEYYDEELTYKLEE